MTIVDLVEKYKFKSPWDLGNKVLYDLCESYPYHKEIDEIVAKIWLIGRSYSASIERRKKALHKGDTFYTKIVAPALKESNIDILIKSLSAFRFATVDNIETILYTHKYLLELFKKISGLDKRSLASKYLHFHKPNLFFIYDSRAISSIRNHTMPVRKITMEESKVDVEYAKFCLRCIQLRDKIKDRHGIHLKPRELDKLLLNE